MSIKNENPDVRWAELPCGVPGYDTTAGGYAGMIREYVAEGELVLALLYLEKARDANVIGRLEAAAQEVLGVGVPAESIHVQAARVLGWTVAEAQALPMQALRELVRGACPTLDCRITEEIRSGRVVTRSGR